MTLEWMKNGPFQKPAEGRQIHLDVPAKSSCSLQSNLFIYLLCLFFSVGTGEIVEAL